MVLINVCFDPILDGRVSIVISEAWMNPSLYFSYILHKTRIVRFHIFWFILDYCNFVNYFEI